MIYAKVALGGGSDEHFEFMRNGMYHDAARAALTAASPLIRAQVATEVRGMLPPRKVPAFVDWLDVWAQARQEAARIVDGKVDS